MAGSHPNEDDDIDRDTVDFQANYDESSHEPVVLPAKFPNLLVNGAGGIAVGMASGDDIRVEPLTRRLAIKWSASITIKKFHSSSFSCAA